MKKLIILCLALVLVFSMAGCGNRAVSIGTYQNENNTEEQVIITQNSIQFVNISFDEFNEELRQDMGVDLHLTDFLSGENAYDCKDGVLSVTTQFGVSVSFEYGKDYITVNGVNFKLC